MPGWKGSLSTRLSKRRAALMNCIWTVTNGKFIHRKTCTAYLRVSSDMLLTVQTPVKWPLQSIQEGLCPKIMTKELFSLETYEKDIL